jgi:hypothetical protein
MIGKTKEVKNLRFYCVLLPAIGCSEYKISQQVTSSMGDSSFDVPEIYVDPPFLEMSGVCNAISQPITISNLGDGDLEITGASIDSESWVLIQPEFPVIIETNGIEIWTVEGNGEGVLTIESNDLVQPFIDIPLSADSDLPPTVQIKSPNNGFVIPVIGTMMTAEVSDDVDLSQDIQMRWVSDIDGLLGSVSANPMGEATLLWQSGHTPGPHEVRVIATDSCQNVEESKINVCQQFGYEVESLDISSWHFEGTASWDSTNEWLELTPVVENVVGSAFSTAVSVNGGNVEINFAFYIGDGTGADGISLTAIDTSRMTTYLGGTGCGIGYGGDAPCTSGPALPGWSIEVDTYYNGGQDPTEEDHLMFTFDGDVDAPAVWSAIPEMEDTGWHNMKVVVNAPNVLVEIDGITYIDQALSGHFSFPSYIGFTAGTGGHTNRHLIDSLTVTESICQSNN